MKPAYFITCLLALFARQATAQLVNQGTLFIGSNTTVTSNETLTNGGTLVNNGSFYLRRDVINNGAISSDIGDLTLDGSTIQTLSGSALTVRNNTFANSASGGAIVLQTPLTVTGTAFFNRGIVKTDAVNRLILDQNAQTANVSNTAHVVGPVQKIGADAFTFPIGSGTVYRPARLEPQGGQPTDVYTANYIESAPSAGGLASCLRSISSREYWQIDRDRGSAALRVGLAYLSSATAPSINDPAYLRVVRFNGDRWEPLTCDANGGLTDGLVFTNGVTQAAGSFTLGSTADALPVELISFSAKLVDGQTYCGWQTGWERNASHFIVERSTDLGEWTELGRVSAQGSNSRYTLTDTRPLAGTSYYRLRQVDTNGNWETYKAVAVINDDVTPFVALLANPTDGNRIRLAVRNLVNPVFQLIHANGHTLPVQATQQGPHYELKPRQSLAAGLYLLQVKSGSFVSTERVLVN